MKIQIFDNHLNYSIYGKGTPILFLHGNGLNKTSMEEVYEPFFSELQQHQRIYLDLPGMGDSDASEDIQSSDDILEYLTKFIEKKQIANNLILFGHSYGGYLCLGIMHQLREKIKGAYLTCPVVYGETHKRRVENGRTIIEEEFIVEKNKEYYDDYLEMNTRINRKSWDLYNITIIPGIEKTNQAFMENVQRQNQKYYKFSFEDTLTISDQTQLTIMLGRYDNV
ncbi:MAG: alpha/beta fold hydrolase, partial [Tetragenococcus koreensis]|nr:alpha/beta fold hydrolase [Tetragenococcus koreensis]